MICDFLRKYVFFVADKYQNRLDEELLSCSRTPKQTPHFDTRPEINPSRTLVKNEIMKTFKNAQNIGNRARKCISSQMGKYKECVRITRTVALYLT